MVLNFNEWKPTCGPFNVERFLFYFLFPFYWKANVKYWISILCACALHSALKRKVLSVVPGASHHCVSLNDTTYTRSDAIFLPIRANKTAHHTPFHFYLLNVNAIRLRSTKDQYIRSAFHRCMRSPVSILRFLSMFRSRDAVDPFHWAWNWKQLRSASSRTAQTNTRIYHMYIRFMSRTRFFSQQRHRERKCAHNSYQIQISNGITLSPEETAKRRAGDLHNNRNEENLIASTFFIQSRNWISSLFKLIHIWLAICRRLLHNMHVWCTHTHTRGTTAFV